MGGRRGVKSKRTIYRELRERAVEITARANGKSVAEIIAVNRTDYSAERLNALGEALGVFLGMARTEVDPEKRRDYYLEVVMTADKLLSFRSPRLASIGTSAAKVSVPDRMGVTEQQVMAEIIAEIRESGELPRVVQDYLEAYSNGGVANRDAD